MVIFLDPGFHEMKQEKFDSNIKHRSMICVIKKLV